MRFFSRLVFICNVCFIIGMIFRFIELRPANVDHNAVIPLPFLEGSIAVLGLFLAVLINTAFVFIILFRKSIRRHVNVPRFIIWFNILLLPVQIWYHFFRNNF